MKPENDATSAPATELACRPPRDDKHRRRVVMAALVLIAVIIPTIAFTVFPRVEVEFKVWYSEGLMGSVSVDLEVRNTGTVTVQMSSISLIVMDDNLSVIAERAYTGVSLNPRARYAADNIYVSSGELLNHTAWDTFIIRLDTSISTGSREIALKRDFTTTEPSMSIVFSEKVSSWGY